MLHVGLSPEEEALVSSWMMKKAGNSVAVARTGGTASAGGFASRLQVAESRIKLPQLTAGEVVNLQKQILDLAEQLREISQFSSARVLDS